MIASVVRRDEVAAFLKFTLVLAVICALGMVWEDQATHNVFFEWSDKLLPGGLPTWRMSSAGWDTMGRRFVHGPTAHPLVAAGMLSMALPDRGAGRDPRAGARAGASCTGSPARCSWSGC